MSTYLPALTTALIVSFLAGACAQETFDTCKLPAPCAETWFGCDSDTCPDTNAAERTCVLELLRDGSPARFRPLDALSDDGEAQTWVLVGDAERTVWFATPADDGPRRCPLKPAAYFQACIDAGDPWDPCTHIFSWLDVDDVYKDCPVEGGFTCPDA